jgi:site-specific recombinase XerD
MIEINWKKDYEKEFTCPRCHVRGLKLSGSNNENKKVFKCDKCGKKTNESCNLKPEYFSIRVPDFACPSSNCNARYVVIKGIQYGKKYFQCKVCGATAVESNDITKNNLSRYAQKSIAVEPFIFENDKWDLRAINSLFNVRNARYIINFASIKCPWFKDNAKKYIYYLCKLNKPFSTIEKSLTSFNQFSDYLIKHNISCFKQINRDLIINFIAWRKTTDEVVRTRLSKLKQFFTIGNIHDWFQIDPDIIRVSDYPKVKINNPDPIPDTVREQIEKKLYKLPEPIARMWIVCFFAAMRPYELALLKQDCLVQQGDKWSLVWWRNKGKNFHQHSVPITRTIAKVVQEQKEYIQQLWGKDWEYLFCHYQNISQSDATHPRLKPVKKVIPTSGSPLQKAIRTFIKVENILDDNGKIGEFSPCLIRETRLTELFLKGHDLSVVSAWAGHKRLSTTANFYTQVTCEQIEKEVGHIHSTLVNVEGKRLNYESMPKSFWENPASHELILSGTHVNTPIYGYCGLPLDRDCQKFRACYTCSCFVPKLEKLPLYIQQRDELKEKQSQALANGHDVLVEQFGRLADQLDKIIAGLQEAA